MKGNIRIFSRNENSNSVVNWCEYFWPFKTIEWTKIALHCFITFHKRNINRYSFNKNYWAIIYSEALKKKDKGLKLRKTIFPTINRMRSAIWTLQDSGLNSSGTNSRPDIKTNTQTDWLTNHRKGFFLGVGKWWYRDGG